MADKNAAMFWIKHLILAAVVIAAAIFVLRYNPETSDQSIQTSGQDSEDRASIAENVTSFYQEFRMSSRDPIKEQYGDFVLPLEMPEETQTEQLVAITSVERPPEASWEGEFKFRSFAKDTTIRVEAMKYAEQEGMQLIWDLNQDFIIRQRFLTESTLLGSLQEISGAIDANFIPKVDIYFCNKKRAIVITDEAGSYVLENCTKAGFDSY
jgi:hypothetical protein